MNRRGFLKAAGSVAALIATGSVLIPSKPVYGMSPAMASLGDIRRLNLGEAEAWSRDWQEIADYVMPRKRALV